MRVVLTDGGEASVHEFAVSEEGEEGTVTTVSWWSAGLMLGPNTCLVPHHSQGTTQHTINCQAGRQVLQLNNQEHFLTSLANVRFN